MVAAEFLRQSVAPLRSHSRPLWTLGGLADETRLSTTMVDAEEVNYATWVLFGAVNVAKPSGDIRPLYQRMGHARVDSHGDAHFRREGTGG